MNKQNIIRIAVIVSIVVLVIGKIITMPKILVGMFLAVPVSAVLGILGLLLLLVAMVATVICGVLKLVYLHRMIEIFRWYQDKTDG